LALVSLDTPQFHLLERVRRIDPVRYFSFRDTWRSRGCTLVFTMAQASELGRYGNTPRREARYQLIADLAPIRTDLFDPVRMSSGPRILIQREIVRAMVQRGLIKAINSDADPLAKWTEILPGHLNASQAGLLRAIENEVYRDLSGREYKAAQFAAAAQKADGQIEKKAPDKAHGQTEKKERVRDLPSTPLTAEKMLAACAGMEKAIASLQEQFRRGELPPIPADAIPSILDLARGFFGRATEIGIQAALLEQLPVTGSTKAELLKMTRDDLVNNSVFKVCVRTFARDVLKADETDQDFLARTLSFTDCPGSWLQRRLDLCVRRNCPEPKPNHHFDAERLGYLPYVDLMLTDKQMVEFVRQIRNDKSTPARIRNVRPAVSIPNSIDALEEKVNSLCAPSCAAAASV